MAAEIEPDKEQPKMPKYHLACKLNAKGYWVIDGTVDSYDLDIREGDKRVFIGKKLLDLINRTEWAFRADKRIMASSRPDDKISTGHV